ncbi:unnamed protein product [Gongylonema pulchrum]|uniref:Secreted protein n=1 Tax=Gongylonema pulchrum TaxID=637853 RepID=A0A183DGA4_9BILA|nr:unnamed protein product [Gongylonema pulchrum]
MDHIVMRQIFLAFFTLSAIFAEDQDTFSQQFRKQCSESSLCQFFEVLNDLNDESTSEWSMLKCESTLLH